MRKQKVRTYKTLANARRYACKLMDKHPGRTFSALPDPRYGSFKYVVGYLIDRDGAAVKWALCS
jgi:hypothetical protein